VSLFVGLGGVFISFALGCLIGGFQVTWAIIDLCDPAIIDLLPPAGHSAVMHCVSSAHRSLKDVFAMLNQSLP
jgi:hypothetical protein